jgi:hypothetical protein
MYRKIILFFLAWFFVADFAGAQQNPAGNDSTKLYRDIETFSKKRKSTNFLYKILFKPVDVPAASKKKLKKKKKIESPYRAFEGKIIRAIHIETLDPFGYSVADTTSFTENNLYKAGNKLHVKSQRITIRNLLLIHKNEPFDSLLVKESERLIRSQRYVHEVSFSVLSAGKKSDSVDIYIRELDNWSIIPEGAISTSSFRIDLTDKNFLGFGHEYENTFSRNYDQGKNSFTTNYSIPNIRNTYISTTLHYGIDGYRNFNRSVTVDRPFFSPFAKWAAGASVTYQYRKDSIRIPGLSYVATNFKLHTQDFWAGKSQQIFKGRTEDARTTNLILSGRYLRLRYLEKPPDAYDPFHHYSNEDFYLAGIGISTRKYSQDHYIFNYGVTEDVPVGKVYGLTVGYQVRNNIGRLYSGLRFSYGNYNVWGYLSCNFEYGTFFRGSHTEQSAFTTGVNYFTDLFEIGSWKFRQFVKPQLTLGIDRFPYETITINNENGIRGFNSTTLSGTKKIVFTLQTQSYSPWNVLGFHFGPYLIYSLGMIGNESSGFKRSRVYSQFGFGVLIKNEFLVFDVFQVSVAFYPAIPGEGEDIFKINPNSTTDFGFRDFILGKPGTVVYQ